VLYYLFSQYDMTVVDYEEIPIHSGSIRVYIKNNVVDLSRKVCDRLKDEINIGLTRLSFYNDFASRAKESIVEIKTKVKDLNNRGYNVVGFGASGRATQMCNLCKFTTNDVKYIVDESPERVGRYIAGSHIPIVGNLGSDVDFVFIFAWNYAKTIMSKLKNHGCEFIVPLPKCRIFESLVDADNLLGI